VKNGKQVTVVVELQARFDEEANINIAQKLQEAGAKIVYGVPGLKVHSKLLLITRKEGKSFTHYAHIGTGNFNEQTAKVYTDFSLLTADKRITTELSSVFDFYDDNLQMKRFKHLLVAPFFMRKRLIQLVNREIANAKAKKEACIMLKMNSLVDPEMISKLYEASRAGVKIKLVVRGICSIIPGKKGMSENIEAVSIVDKFLEHGRLFIFANGGNEEVYISSADWMIRNFDYRSEVAVPIFDPEIKKQLKDIFEIQLADNTKARILDALQENKYVRNKKKKVRAQIETYKYLKLTNQLKN
jgi:polyphosphate kinase